MNFSKNKKMIRCFSLIAVLILMTALFAGCKKDDTTPPESTEGDLNLNINLETEGQTEPTETEPQPTETEPVISEKSATVTSQLNIRSAPSTTGSSVIGTLYAGDKVTVEERYEVTGVQWAYISEPQTGWICMDFVEMDIPDAPNNTTATPAGSDSDNQSSNQTTNNNSNTSTTSTKGVVTTGLNIRKEPSTTNSAIVGAYSKGDVVTILESSNGWGRTNKGWIKLQYVNTTGTTTNTNNNTNTNTTNNNTTGNGSTTVQFRGIVIANDLNIRASASIESNRVGGYSYGARVEFYEKSGNWGRTDKGWIRLDYVYQDGTTGSKTGSGTVTGNGVNIRTGPGTGYGAVGSVNSGDRVTILEQFTYNGTTWGCTKNGWICMDYVRMDGTESGESRVGTVTGNNVNIRSGPGTNYNSVGSLNEGDQVTVLTQQTVNGTVWGNIKQGWICMDYVDLN